mmetsp:Transcript_11675/g.21287  ORF Transcript_11675/g.21287 Transcript_11675/m.21287 type:complete len:96 (+) Transcript_11675:807-1094(+)
MLALIMQCARLAQYHIPQHTIPPTNYSATNAQGDNWAKTNSTEQTRSRDNTTNNTTRLETTQETTQQTRLDTTKETTKEPTQEIRLRDKKGQDGR